MPRKRPAKLSVLADTPEDDEPENKKPPPASKRRRQAADADDSATNGRLLKRQALDHKSINSTEGSLLRSRLDIKQEEKDEKLSKPLNDKKLPPSKLKYEEPPEEDFNQALEKLLPPDNLLPFLEHLSQKSQDGIQELADLVTDQDCWTPELVALFSTTAITSLDLSAPSTSEPTFLEVPDSTLLAPLFVQNRFTSLTTLSLRNLSLSDDDLAFLRLLPSLTTLDLHNTNIGTHALHHLVCHRYTLTSLNIAMNPRITDDTRIILRALSSLTFLFLRGTSFTLPALRRLVMDDLPRKCRLLSLPAPVIDHLNTRGSKYALDIPPGYMTEPDANKIANMNLPFLKKQLEAHQKWNKDIQTTGTKVELVARLRNVLWNRKADERILEVLGRKETG
ncbi:hypothetical protein EX30DRAFT_341731 [Ascodesmis nigricans]|uniref:Uncharacterized protein n=1 Tax=Ascodesmis nigricans TaxID=341454 RepID=A0A4S2MUA9_9PEZI|nr:hypothetical protein EX30DRAFT_341731 [Ascodesmis nigricans]